MLQQGREERGERREERERGEVLQPVSLTMVTMVHYPVFAEPFVLVVIRGALDKSDTYNLRLLTAHWLELYVVGQALAPPF